MNIVLYSLISIATTWVTFFLNRNLKFGPVKASSFIALLVGGFFQINEVYFHIPLPKDILFIVLGSTFIGMVSSRKHFRNFHFNIAPIIFVLIYHFISDSFKGFGGALGTAACISLIITIYLRSLKSTKYIIKPFRRVKLAPLKLRRKRCLKRNI